MDFVTVLKRFCNFLHCNRCFHKENWTRCSSKLSLHLSAGNWNWVHHNNYYYKLLRKKRIGSLKVYSQKYSNSFRVRSTTSNVDETRLWSTIYLPWSLWYTSNWWNLRPMHFIVKHILKLSTLPPPQQHTNYPA